MRLGFLFAILWPLAGGGMVSAQELDSLPPLPPPPGESAVNEDAAQDSDVQTIAPQRVDQETNPEDEQVRIPARIALRLRVLERDLTVLGSRGSGVADSVIAMVMGAGTIGLGIGFKDELPAEYLYVYGSASIVRGALSLALRPSTDDAALEFTHKPTFTVRDVRKKLRFGENALQSAADRTRWLRILDASIEIGTGLLVIPLWFGPRDYEIVDAFDYFVIIGAVASAASGVISLATRSEAEKRWDAYVDLRRELARERRRQNRSSVRASGFFSPRVAGIGITAEF